MYRPPLVPILIWVPWSLLRWQVKSIEGLHLWPHWSIHNRHPVRHIYVPTLVFTFLDFCRMGTLQNLQVGVGVYRHLTIFVVIFIFLWMSYRVRTNIFRTFISIIWLVLLTYEKSWRTWCSKNNKMVQPLFLHLNVLMIPLLIYFKLYFMFTINCYRCGFCYGIRIMGVITVV